MGQKPEERRMKSWAWGRDDALRRAWELRHLRELMSRAMRSRQTSGILSRLLVAVKSGGPLGQALNSLLVRAGPKAFTAQAERCQVTQELMHPRGCLCQLLGCLPLVLVLVPMRFSSCCSPSSGTLVLAPSHPRRLVISVFSPSWSLQAVISQVKRWYDSCTIRLTAAFPWSGGKSRAWTALHSCFLLLLRFLSTEAYGK